MLTLYYLIDSPPTRSVDLVIHALGLTAEYKHIDLFKQEHLTPEYLKLNPLHTVPTLVDDGFVLWESRAIMTYLVSKYGKDDSLYPKDLKKRAIVDQRLHYSNDVFYALSMAIKHIFHLNKPATEDQLEKIKEAQTNIEKLLEGNQFMAGDSLTVADHSFVTFIDVVEFFSPPGSSFPLTKGWFERCKSTMKDFEKVNKEGAELMIELINKF